MIDGVDLLQRLIRIDTTNPPGREREAMELVRSLLVGHGVDVGLVAADPERPNLIARIRGDDAAPPLLLQGHMDVVPADPARWSVPPFEGRVEGGFVWGRGALDMKGPIVMMIDAVLRLVDANERPAGDVVLCLMPDEERGSEIGAKHLVGEHPEIFDGVEHAIGEFGGFSYHLDGTEFVPIQVSERIGVEFTVTTHGPSGHGSLPVSDGAMARMGAVLTALDRADFPVHIAPATRFMLEGIARHSSGATRFAVNRLLDERTASLALSALGGRLERIGPLLRNTASPTIVRAGASRNVIPETATVTLDGRMVPGQTPESFLAELRSIVGGDCDITYETEWTGHPPDLDLSLFPLLEGILREMRPGVVPLPFMQSGVTDGRVFGRLGIQTYGFTPMPLPHGFAFERTVHGVDERIPVGALEFGARAVTELLRRYGR